MLASEALSQFGLDRRAGEVRVNVGIAFAPKHPSHFFDVRRAREFKRSFDDVWGVHVES